jgi:hypothetical protein
MSKSITEVLDNILIKMGTGEQLTAEEQEAAITSELLSDDEGED